MISKSIVIEISKSEYDDLSDSAKETKLTINENIATIESHFKEIEDPGLKILLTECVRELKTNITKLKNHVIFNG